MDKLNLKLGLKAKDKKIKFQYTIEDSIADAQMFIVISVLEAIKEKTELEDIISVFCKGKENDQYKLMQYKFIDIFKDDNVKSFSDFKNVKSRASEIFKKGSMILDANSIIDITYLEEIERYIFNISSKDHYIAKEEISEFIKVNLQSFIKVNSIKNPKFKEIKSIEDESETRIIEIEAKINHKLDKIFIQNEEFSKGYILNIAKEEIRRKSLSALKEIPIDIADIKKIKIIPDNMDILTTNPLLNEKIILGWNSPSNNKENNLITYKKDEINSYGFFEYKKIIVYSKNEITISDLINSIDIKNFSSPFSKDMTTRISENLDQINQLVIIEAYSKENDGLDLKIENSLLKNIEILIGYKTQLVSYLTIYNKILDNKLEDKSQYYKLISKHYKKELDYNDDKIVMFFHWVNNESSHLLLKKETILVQKMVKDKNNIKDEYKKLLGVAAELRTKLNKLIEDKNKFISNKKTQDKSDEIRQYLNAVNHINEDQSNKSKIISSNPELKEWINISRKGYIIEELEYSHIDKIEKKFIQFDLDIKDINKNIEESMNQQNESETP